MDAYWQGGLHGLSVNEICRLAKISKPGLYRDFGDEDGLMKAFLDHYRASVLGRLFETIAAERPFRDTLVALLEWITDVGERPRGCLSVRMRTSPDRLGPSTTARVQDIQDEMIAMYRAWFERGLQSDEVRRSIGPELAALYIDTQLCCRS